MSLLSPSNLNEVQGATNPEVLCSQNFAILNVSYAFQHAPTGDNIVVGPPTTGTHVLSERWIDSLGAVFVCTVAGTSGTWLQIQPAIIPASSKPATPPTGYQVLISDGNFRREYFLGGAWIDQIEVYNQTDGKHYPAQLVGAGDTIRWVFGAPLD